MATVPPLVSVLLPVYNVEDYLSICLESILAQTYQNLQIVLLDDGSQDNSSVICKKYAQKDKRVEFYQQKNKGVAETRNNLLSYAKGKYILFVDSDDWIELDMIEKLVYLSEFHKADIITCGYVINDALCKKDDETYQIWSKKEAVYQFLRHVNFRGFLWNKLIRTNLFHNERFQKDISYGEDALMCWYILQKVKNVLITNMSLYHHRINNNSISNERFGPKKMSAFDVWKIITNDTVLFWPDYIDVAYARSCIEMTILLREASHSGYKHDENIKLLQTMIRENASLIYKTKLSSWKMYLYALIGGKSYKLLSLLP